MLLLRILLFPFTLLYDGVTRFRNHLYNIGYTRSFQFEIPVIGVGNLNVGGSGKTPMIEYLVRLLISGNHITVLSRGYGRLTKGLRFARDNDSALTIGDEPLQFFKSFKGKVNVVVCEDRAFAIPNILYELPQTDLILMDDSFQHRSVNPKLNILLTEYASPFYKDYVMPFGKLREARIGSTRADVIIVTKCDSKISDSEMNDITYSISRIAGNKPIFFTSIEYGIPVSFFGTSRLLSKDVILVSGISNHITFEAYAQTKYNVMKHFCYKDHHQYHKDQLLNIRKFLLGLGKPVSILTTEKDMVRLVDPELVEIIKEMPWFHLPIETVFLKDGSEFDKLVTQAIKV
ncbi:MAG: tetraacyldisaccharide 4'-kinase [Bacteroidota bacterium]